MTQQSFHNQRELEEAAEKFAKQAMSQGLIPSFVIHYFPDSWVFYVETMDSSPFTPEEAYLHLKRMVEEGTDQ